MASAGLMDTHLSLILTYAALSVSFSTWFLAGYFRSVPREIEEAAMVDGSRESGHWSESSFRCPRLGS